MRLRMRVSVCGPCYHASVSVNIIMTLRWAGNSIGPIQAGVKPLRRIWRGHLLQKHYYKFIIKNLRVRGRREISITLAPISPGADQTMYYLFYAFFRPKHGGPVSVQL